MSLSEKLGLATFLFGLWLAAWSPNLLEYGLFTALLGAIPFVLYREE